MDLFSEGLRHFWMSNLHTLGNSSNEGLGKWLLRRDFVPIIVPETYEFTILALDPMRAKRAFSWDSARMASAAFETILDIKPSTDLPRSAGWIVIRVYYAAFFAAHSLLRIFGISCTHLGENQVRAIDRIISALGSTAVSGVQSGFYVSRYIDNTNEIYFLKNQNRGRKGSHEIMWEEFVNQLRLLSTHLVNTSSRFDPVVQKLSEIDDFMSKDGANNGTWLSYIRNAVNYKFEYGIWFPYTDSTISAADLISIIQKWNVEPSRFPAPRKNPVFLHVWLCTFIVCLCNSVVRDIELASPRGRCSHKHLGLALQNLLHL